MRASSADKGIILLAPPRSPSRSKRRSSTSRTTSSSRSRRRASGCASAPEPDEKEGFFWPRVGARLSENGLGYIHIKALGTPAPLRHALRNGGLSFDEFAPQFEALLGDRDAELDALLHLARSQTVALMCWEEDPNACHRSLVARALQRRSGASVEVCDIRRMDL
jgi:uncharacterized protein YeaO (DUF488 family)